MHTDAVDSVLGTKKAEAMGQFDLFGGADDGGTGDSVFTIKVPDEEWEDKHKLALEREMLGLYVSGHPLNGVAHLLAAQVDTAIPAILDGDVANETQVRVGGILASVNRRVNKNGMPWASAQLEDLTGGIEVMFFPQTYSTFGAEIADDAVVLVGAKVAIRDDRISLIANELVVPDFSNAQVEPAAGRQPADPAVHGRQGHRAQAGAGPPSRNVAGAPAADQRRAHHHAGTGPVAAGDAVLGADGRSEGAAGPGLPGLMSFRELHEQGCFVIPNPWDRGTAIALAAMGFPALATTSAGVSFAQGLPDTPTALGVDAALRNIAEIVDAVELPVNADFQAGYADDLDGLAANVRRCVATGVAGLSIEDARGGAEDPLYSLPEAVERIRVAQSADRRRRRAPDCASRMLPVRPSRSAARGDHAVAGLRRGGR